MKPTDFAYYIGEFLTKYLAGQRNFSENTIKSYRDTFMLLLIFFRDEKHLKPERLTLKSIDKDSINDFLLWLQNNRSNSTSTINQRLAAIHSFFRYIQGEKPEYLFESQRILSIKFKRCPRPCIEHLSENVLTEILAAPDVSTPTGRRDLALLCLLYDTGARVSELTDLTVRDIRFEKPCIIKLTGKGNKSRFVSLMDKTAKILENYMREQNLFAKLPEHPLFFNRQGLKLTRAGVAYILKKYALNASADITSNRISPHVFRHTKAMHLLNADVNIVYIRDILGHSQLSTTEIYAKSETEKKRKALEKLNSNAIPSDAPSWETDKGLLDWLSGLCK